MPSGAALQRPKLSAGARAGLVVAGIGVIALTALHTVCRAPARQPTVPAIPAKKQVQSSPELAIAKPPRALNLTEPSAFARAVRLRRDVFHFVVAPPRVLSPAPLEHIEPQVVAPSERAEQVVPAPFTYAGRIGDAAVLVSASHHWLVHEGDVLGSPPTWQVQQISVESVLVVELATGRAHVLMFPPKR